MWWKCLHFTMYKLYKDVWKIPINSPNYHNVTGTFYFAVKLELEMSICLFAWLNANATEAWSAYMSNCQGWQIDEVVNPHKVLPVPKCEVFNLSHYRSLSTRHLLDLCHMWLTGLLSFCSKVNVINGNVKM